jgi:hypothetical protein
MTARGSSKPLLRRMLTVRGESDVFAIMTPFTTDGPWAIPVQASGNDVTVQVRCCIGEALKNEFQGVSHHDRTYSDGI